MNIAIIVWGSLYWKKGTLETKGEWFYDGPYLPIEFARISLDKRLTLVIKPTFDSVPTLYIASSFQSLADARENLRSRENTENIGNIGFIDFTNNLQHVRQSNVFIIDIIRQWNENKGFDAIIWSDFSPRFRDAIYRDFNIQNVITFIEELPGMEKQTALEYIKKTPPQIITRFRKRIERYFDL